MKMKYFASIQLEQEESFCRFTLMKVAYLYYGEMEKWRNGYLYGFFWYTLITFK